MRILCFLSLAMIRPLIGANVLSQHEELNVLHSNKSLPILKYFLLLIVSSSPTIIEREKLKNN